MSSRPEIDDYRFKHTCMVSGRTTVTATTAVSGAGAITNAVLCCAVPMLCCAVLCAVLVPLLKILH